MRTPLAKSVANRLIFMDGGEIIEAAEPEIFSRCRRATARGYFGAGFGAIGEHRRPRSAHVYADTTLASLVLRPRTGARICAGRHVALVCRAQLLHFATD